MTKAKDDLIGKIFGRLTVLERADDKIDKNGCHKPQWLCECSCDEHNKVVVREDCLKNGNTKSCGCLHREGLIEIGHNNKKYNKYDLSGDYGIGWSNNTNEEFYFDLEDYNKIKDYCWSVHVLQNGYHALEARDININSIVRMQWIIIGKNYDHIDRNPLNNRKSNLRPATKGENNRNHKKFINNTSGFSGVNWHKRLNKWVARITVNNKRVHLGYFDSKTDAVVARLRAELKYYGTDFAPQRHLFKEYGIELNK